MSKVLVKAAGVSAQYPVGAGGPVMVLGGGGGNAPRGRTKTQRALSALGTGIGVLGAGLGQHRSLGGLVQSAISGGAQGGQLGEALGRKLTPKEWQARADLRAGSKLDATKERAKLAEATRARGQGPMSRFNPAAAYRRYKTGIQDKHQQELERVNRSNRASDAARVAVTGELGRQARAGYQARTAKDRQDLQSMNQIREMFGDDVHERVNVAHSAWAQMGRQPNVNAANQPVQVIDSSMHPNMLPAPSPSAQEASAGKEINDIESAGDTEAMQTGTDMTDSMSPEQQKALAAQGFEDGGQMGGPQGNVIAGGDSAKGKAAMMAKLNQWHTQGKGNTPQYAQLWQMVNDME